jgi:hypothetical protein
MLDSTDKIAERNSLVLFGLAVVTLAAILHAYQLVIETRIVKEARPFHADLFPGRLHLFLLCAFLLVAAGLLIGTRMGLICSVFGLMIVFLGHVWWLYYSYALLHVINYGLYERHPDLRNPSLFGFVGARWWDMVLLILFIALFICEIKTLLETFKRRMSEGSPKLMAN